MPDPLLVTIIGLKILRYILFPGQKVHQQLSEKIQDGYLLTLVSAAAGYGKTVTLLR